MNMKTFFSFNGPRLKMLILQQQRAAVRLSCFSEVTGELGRGSNALSYRLSGRPGCDASQGDGAALSSSGRSWVLLNQTKVMRMSG